MMEIRMELNQRHGHGFQLRMLHGPMDKVFDQESLTLYEAGGAANMLLEAANKELGTDYQLHQVCRVPQDALEANAATDFAAARMLQDIRSKNFSLSVPAGQDAKEMEINGKPEMMLSARGMVLFFLSAWRLDGNEKAHDCLRRYCEYIAAHGFKGGASKALGEMDNLDKEDAANWVRRTYAQYIQDDAALIQYVGSGIL